MTTPVIDINDLCFSYSGKEVLHEINLTIQARDFVAVIGPNGGGKTSLLKLMLGLLRPTRGSILINGKPVGSNNATIGYVPQQINHNLSFPATALDIVLMGKHRPERRFVLSGSKKDRQDAMHALEKIGIADFANRKITNLSGGQRQRVLIARALVTQPELLVLDEPTASLDTKGQAKFYELLQTLNESQTIFMVSHDLLSISSYAKSIACINKRLYCHQPFSSAKTLLKAFYACSAGETLRSEGLSPPEAANV